MQYLPDIALVHAFQPGFDLPSESLRTKEILTLYDATEERRVGRGGIGRKIQLGRLVDFFYWAVWVGEQHRNVLHNQRR